MGPVYGIISKRLKETQSTNLLIEFKLRFKFYFAMKQILAVLSDRNLNSRSLKF